MPSPLKVIRTMSTSNVGLTTTTETEIVQIDGVSLGPGRLSVLLFGWVQLTTGAATTTVTPRIRRGTDTTGSAVREGNPINVGAAAGSTEVFDILAEDPTPGEGTFSYVLTLQQASATGNGTALQYALQAILL